MNLIMENWRRSLKEEFAGEEDWNQGFDSDFGSKYDPKTGGVKIEGFTLIIVDPSFLKEKYPKPSGKNHGLASHAIKHAPEFFDINNDVKIFKDNVQKLYNSGKDLYIRSKEGQTVRTYKINNRIADNISKFKKGLNQFLVNNGYDPKQMRDEGYRDEWNKKRPGLEERYTQKNAALVDDILSLYLEDKPKEISPKTVESAAKVADAILQKIKKLGTTEFLVFLDFYYDMNRLDLVDNFDGEMINKYKKMIDKFVKDGSFVQDPNDPQKTVLTTPTEGGTAVIIKRNDKISSAMKVKGSKKPEDFFKY